MHKRFPLSAKFTHATGERRLIFVAPEEPKPLDKFGDIIKRDVSLRTALREKADALLTKAKADAADFNQYRKDVIDQVKEMNNAAWELLSPKDRKSISDAFPKSMEEFEKFATNLDIVDEAAGAELREKLKAERPVAMKRNADTMLGDGYIDGEGTEEEFNALIKELKDIDAKNAASFRQKPTDVIRAERKERYERRKNILATLNTTYRQNYERYDFQKNRSSRRLTEAMSRRAAQNRGPVDPLLGDSQAERDFKNVTAKNRRQVSRSLSPEESARANLIKEWTKNDYVPGDPVEKGEIYNPKLKRIRADGKGGYTDHTADFDAWQESQKGSSTNTASNRGKKVPGKRPGMFGGTVDEAGYKKMVKGSTDHLDKNVQNDPRAASSDKYFKLATEALADLKKYPNADQATSFPQLQLVVQQEDYQKIVFYVGVVKRELALKNNFDAITAIPTKSDMETHMDIAMDYSHDKPANLNEKIFIHDVTMDKNYWFRPQKLHSATEGAEDIQNVQEMAKAGIIVKLERNGPNIPYSQMKYVSGITIGLRADSVDPTDASKKITEEKKACVKISSLTREDVELYNAYEAADVTFVNDPLASYEAALSSDGSAVGDLAAKEAEAEKPTGLKLRIPSNDQSPDKLPFQTTEEMTTVQRKQNELRFRAKDLGLKYKKQAQDLGNALMQIATKNKVTIASIVASDGKNLPASDSATAQVLLKQGVEIAMKNRALQEIQSGLSVQFAKISEDWSLAMYPYGVDRFFGSETIDATINKSDGKVYGGYSIIKKPGTLMKSLDAALTKLETESPDVLPTPVASPAKTPNPAAPSVPAETPATTVPPTVDAKPTAAPKAKAVPVEAPAPTPTPAPAATAESAPEYRALTKEEFDQRKSALIQKQNTLLKRMDGYGGQKWDDYKNNTVKKVFDAANNYVFNPANPPVLNTKNVNGRKFNEWNIEQLELIYESYKGEVESKIGTPKPGEAGSKDVAELSPPPATAADTAKMKQLLDETPDATESDEKEATARMRELAKDANDTTTDTAEDDASGLPMELGLYQDFKKDVVAVDALLLKIQSNTEVYPAAKNLRDKCVKVLLDDPDNIEKAQKMLIRLRTRLETLSQQ